MAAAGGKKNPSLKEGKSKPGEEKSKLFPSANRAFSKGCAGPSRHLRHFQITPRCTYNESRPDNLSNARERVVRRPGCRFRSVGANPSRVTLPQIPIFRKELLAILSLGPSMVPPPSANFTIREDGVVTQSGVGAESCKCCGRWNIMSTYKLSRAPQPPGSKNVVNSSRQVF
jgi:hypothetical protein